MKLTNFEKWYTETLQSALDKVESTNVKQIKQLSAIFPEKYSLLDEKGERVGYIILKQDMFSLYAPSLGGNVIMSGKVGGEALYGRFSLEAFINENERIEIFKKCFERLDRFYENEFYDNKGE